MDQARGELAGRVTFVTKATLMESTMARWRWFGIGKLQDSVGLISQAQGEFSKDLVTVTLDRIDHTPSIPITANFTTGGSLRSWDDDSWVCTLHGVLCNYATQDSGFELRGGGRPLMTVWDGTAAFGYKTIYDPRITGEDLPSDATYGIVASPTHAPRIQVQLANATQQEQVVFLRAIFQ